MPNLAPRGVLFGKLGPLKILVRQIGPANDAPRYWTQFARLFSGVQFSTQEKSYMLGPSIRAHPKGAILETCGLWDIWSEWWEDMTWHTKTNLPTYLPTYLPIPTYLPTYTLNERSLRLVTFETFDQSGEKTRPDTKKNLHTSYLPTYLTVGNNNLGTLVFVHFHTL